MKVFVDSIKTIVNLRLPRFSEDESKKDDFIGDEDGVRGQSTCTVVKTFCSMLALDV